MTNNETDLTAAAPREIDAKLAELSVQWAKLNDRRINVIDSLRRIDGQSPTYRGRSSAKVWVATVEETIASVTGKLERDEIRAWEVKKATEKLAEVDKLEDEMRATRKAAVPFDAEYDRRPWQRFFTVTGGHIHSGMWCAGGSIRWNTDRGWNPELSNASVADAVKQLGPNLCTKCFPQAPTEWSKGTDKPAGCAGSGKRYVEGTRLNRYPSSYGQCPECKTLQIVTKSGAIRKHQPAAQ